jgi:hypothetical protein
MDRSARIAKFLLSLGLAALLAAVCFSCADPLLVEDPQEMERSQMPGIWHLEDYMENATSLSSIAGVYWSARDLDPSPIGNHHFITIVWQSKEQADAFLERYGVGYNSFANQVGIAVHYTTLGVQTDDGSGSGSIIIEFNNASDVQAVKEEVNPGEYIHWYAPDYDFEAHLMPFGLSSSGFGRLGDFMKAVLSGAQNFNRHHEAGTRLPYSLFEQNCACIANSEFNALGFSASDRERLGEFSGIDIGEENLVDAGYFDADFVHE